MSDVGWLALLYLGFFAMIAFVVWCMSGDKGDE